MSTEKLFAELAYSLMDHLFREGQSPREIAAEVNAVGGTLLTEAFVYSYLQHRHGYEAHGPCRSVFKDMPEDLTLKIVQKAIRDKAKSAAHRARKVQILEEDGLRAPGVSLRLPPRGVSQDYYGKWNLQPKEAAA